MLDVREVYEDTVYQVTPTLIAVLGLAEVDKARADLPMLSVLQSIRDHIATLVHGYRAHSPDALVDERCPSRSEPTQ